MDELDIFNDQSTSPQDGPMLASARATIAALEDAGALDGSHALKKQLILSGAAKLDQEFKRSQLSTATMALFSKISDISDGLPTVKAAVNDTFDELVANLKVDQ